MTFDLSLIPAMSIGERDRLDAMLGLCPARHLATAIVAALDATQSDGGAADDVWTDAQIGDALAAAVLLFKAGGGDSARVFKFVLCQLASAAAGRLTDPAGRAVS